MNSDAQNAPHTTGPSSSWRAELDSIVDALTPRIQQVREHLHAHPELSGEEFETTAFIRTQLDEHRYDFQTGPEGRGLIATAKDADTNSLVALRADIDALPIQDTKRTPYASQTPGVMHACGHDAHAASVLGAVWATEQALDAGLLVRPLSYRAIFQPAEETNRGALEMCAAGALDGVRAIFGAHMDPSRLAGQIGVREGIFTADCVELAIRIVGKGGHAARPHESLDPIAAGAQLISSLYSFVPRGADSHDPVVLSFGAIHAGDSSNSIPDELTMRGTLRTLSPYARERAKDHIQRLSEGLASASTTGISISYTDGPPALVNDSKLARLIAREARDAFGEANVCDIPTPSMGGEDFANYLDRAPGAMFRVGCASGDETVPLHSPQFDVAPEALAVAAKVLVRTAIAWMEQSAGDGAGQ